MASAAEHDDSDLSDTEPSPVPTRATFSGPGASLQQPQPDSDDDEEELGQDRVEEIKKEAVLRQGWLLKRSKNRMVRWKKRWCVLRRTLLCMYKDQDEYKATKIIKLIDCVAEPVQKHKNRVLKLRTPKRKFYFKATGPDEMHSWVGALNAGRILRNPATHDLEADDEEEDETKTAGASTSSPGLVQGAGTPTAAPAPAGGSPVPHLSPRLKPLKARLSDLDATGTDSEYDSDAAGASSGNRKTRLSGAQAEEEARPSSPKATPELGDVGVTVKYGYLQKKGHVSKRWKRRWFVLRSPGLLSYYKSDKEYELLHIVKLRDCIEIGRVESRKHAFCFQIIMPKRAHTMAAENEDELTAWLTALQTEFSKTRHSDEAKSD